MSEKPWSCDHCKKTFAEAEDVRQHHTKKHRGKKLSKAVKDHIRAVCDDDEPSFAQRSIDAQLDHAMGVHNDDYEWLVEPWE